MSIEHILQKIKDSPLSRVKVAITDIDGVLRGKLMHKEKFLSAVNGGFGFCDVVFGWDMVDESYDNGLVTGWHTGYPDAPARIDVSTFREIPWEEGAPFFLADFSSDFEDFPACPRSLLKRVRDQASDQGYQPVFSQEFEWFNFLETPYTLAEKGYRNPQPLTPGMFGYSILRSSLKSEYFNDLFDLLEMFDVPLEGLHTETGPGVYEAAIRYSDILTAADRAVLFKTAVKEIAAKHEITASFMAKWDQSLPGCSGHVHQSLWKDHANVFYDDGKEDGISDVMKSYMAGQLYCLPHLLPMLAPTTNSYKRLVEGAWAPTTLTWGIDNRTTALRALPGSEKASRLETRVVGSDVNPYLAMAACLASGMYGINNAMSLDIPQTIGNGYKDDANGRLPATLGEATANMKSSDVAKELFGEEFVNYYVRTREWEWAQYDESDPDWEMERYFEII